MLLPEAARYLAVQLVFFYDFHGRCLHFPLVRRPLETEEGVYLYSRFTLTPVLAYGQPGST